jgi:hypothetical protein
VRRTFTLAAERLEVIRASQSSPPEQLERAISTMAGFIGEHAFFPAIMMREVAEGGAHLDRDTLKALAAVPAAFGAMIHEGVTSGAFRPVDPVFAYFTTLAPIVFYLAGAPIRKEITHLNVVNLHTLSPDEFVRHLQESRSFAYDGVPASLDEADTMMPTACRADCPLAIALTAGACAQNRWPTARVCPARSRPRTSRLPRRSADA